MKAALVTGASGDIGTSIARDLAGSGWSLYLHYHSNREKINLLLSELQSAYPEQEFYPICLDLSDEAGVSTLADQIFSLQAIVFAHGRTEYGLLQDMTSLQMDVLWEMHVKMPILIIQALQGKIARSRNGRIVFISSIYGEVGSGLEVLYSTVKGAQIAFVKAYSKEVASMGVTVNAICPGAIDTQMNAHLENAEKEALLEEIPLGRMGRPDEISFWVSQLLKEDSRYMTGQAIYVSGGWLR
ncbi:elongation factor P 5-aminopentanone reductase [Trichococcus pasteurii]|uniref:Glucose/ribitol dehydrogenase n=1 Tax=Trichococcus pasteurii TaxID=43064 RepID=A0A1W1ICH7_9LACT|nr:SDR family oxidoreductase [Trichococcus pasteurii]SFE32407.1 3-oxoacyl-[acyl-carrier protein] reductase [Trichococcus pasteurii]SLM50700.1 glucose/ribitol dehydrogenase [Trichococcus pasteurii]SSB91581.1 glucose/ribitol dehydrogenase [Trichococcus pasteurii]